MQQKTLIKRRGINKTPQESFIVDSIKFIQDLTSKGHEILLNIDANEIWDCRGSRIRELALITGLIDIANHRHEGQVPATYSRINSARRIDYMLGSEGVVKNVMAMGIASADYDPVLGDHRPQYVDLNIKSILHLDVHDNDTPSSGRLKSSNPKSIETYINKAKEHFTAHNIYNRVEDLWTGLNNKVTLTKSQCESYNAIDRDIYRLCTNAESMIRGHRRTKYVWSPSLETAGNEVRYWTQRQRCFNNRPKSQHLVTKGLEKGMCDDVKMEYEEVTAELTQAYGVLE